MEIYHSGAVVIVKYRHRHGVIDMIHAGVIEFDARML